MAGTRNSIIIDAPIEDVWRITNDVPNWPNLFSEYAEANVRSIDGNCIVFELVMHPDENNIVWRWVSKRTLHWEDRMVTAMRVETGPFEFMHIIWNYEAITPTRTRMVWEQRFTMKVTAPVNNVQMTDRLNTNTVIQMQLIKERVEARCAQLVGAR